METIRIVHLFPKLLSLYGEYGNVAILEKSLRESGYSVEVVSYEDGPLSLGGASFVYVGSGTEDNLLEAARRLLPSRAAIADSIAQGTVWLATGNAMTLFGQTISYRGAEAAGLAAFPYTTVLDEKTRYLGDVLSSSDNLCQSPMVGFINTASVYSSTDAPLFTLRLGSRLGNDKKSACDGIYHGRFFGTQLIGPVLVKNPRFLELIFREITGAEFSVPSESNQEKAYRTACTELQKRLEKGHK